MQIAAFSSSPGTISTQVIIDDDDISQQNLESHLLRACTARAWSVADLSRDCPTSLFPFAITMLLPHPQLRGRDLREILPPHDPRALIRSTQPAAISTSVCLARCVQCVFTSGALPVRRRCIPRACDDGSEHARPARGRQAPYSTPASYLTPASGCKKSHRGVPGVQARGEMSQVQEESELVRHGPT